VDFYAPHYYDWMSGMNPDNALYVHPVAYGLPGNRPVVCGECPANGTANHHPEEDYESAFQNGWQGVMGWTSNDVDGNGGLNFLGSATRAMRDHHRALVFPD
jgi:hypothetical protein